MPVKKNTEKKNSDMTLDELRKELGSARPQEWEQIPDIDLYMDQVIMFMQRQHIGLEISNEETLTSAMINNYIKSGVLPRASGKKYSREHIGYLTAICLLKQILSVSDTGSLLAKKMENEDISVFYDEYKKVLDREYSAVAEKLKGCDTESKMADAALELAVSSYAQKLACQQLVDMLDRKNGSEE